MIRQHYKGTSKEFPCNNIRFHQSLQKGRQKTLEVYKKMTEQKEQTTLNPKIVGEMELPKIDLKPFDGVKSKIKEVTFHEHEQHGMYAKVSTFPLNEIEEGSDEKPIYATKVLGLFPQKDKETGTILGYGWGAETKTGLFLKRFEVSNLEDLVGKDVVVKFEVGKGDKQFLSI